MNIDPVIVTIFRWIHIVTACVTVGSVFCMRVIVPAGLRAIESPEARRAAFLRMRRVFKMVVHTAIVLFLISGAYNTWRAWPVYTTEPGLMHALWGLHVLGALVIFGIALYALAGKEPPASHSKLMVTNLVLMLLIIAVASRLKFAREQAMKRHPTAPAVASSLNR